MTPLERFWTKVKKSDGCWEWKGGLGKGGYGKFKAYRKTWRASRFIWIELFGSLTLDQLVLHKCDNRLCVRPDHLHIGSHIENMKEMRERNRAAKGEVNGATKFSSNDVMDILNSTLPQRQLAKSYGVHQGAISHIKCGRNWAHLTGIQFKPQRNPISWQTK